MVHNSAGSRTHKDQHLTGKSPLTWLFIQHQRASCWSGRQDSNLRPLDPQSSALPSCATSRPRPLRRLHSLAQSKQTSGSATAPANGASSKPASAPPLHNGVAPQPHDRTAAADQTATGETSPHRPPRSDVGECPFARQVTYRYEAGGSSAACAADPLPDCDGSIKQPV
jgi:hypothetical protein